MSNHHKLVQSDIRKLVDDNIEFKDEVNLQNGKYREKFLTDIGKVCIDKASAIINNEE